MASDFISGRLRGVRAPGRRRVGLALCLLFLLFAPTGCPIGSELADNGGIGGTGISQGPISSFGSIFVNGVEWETDGAEIDLDDVPGVQEALRLGMVVRVEGVLHEDGLRGDAHRVIFDDDVEGPIQGDVHETIPGVEKRFSVLGCTVVVVVGFTHFDGTASFEGLEAYDLVEVSGLPDAEGHIRATRVEGHDRLDPGSSHGELRGDAADFQADGPDAGVFFIGGNRVRYDATTAFDGLSAADLASSPHVEVEGVLLSTDEIQAERIELEGKGFGGTEGEKVKVTGFVTDFVSIADFEVLGVRVDASAARIDGDVELANGELVEIEGTLLGGVLVAEEVDEADDDDASVLIGATVQSIDHQVRRLQILGLTVKTNGKTRMEDEFLDLPNFGFDDVTEGDWLEIRARESGGPGTVMATSIIRRSAGADTYLQGRVTFHDLPQEQIAILGIDLPGLDLSGGTHFFDALGNEITPNEFIALLAPPSEAVVLARDVAAVDPGFIDEVDDLEFGRLLDPDDDDDDDDDD